MRPRVVRLLAATAAACGLLAACGGNDASTNDTAVATTATPSMPDTGTGDTVPTDVTAPTVDPAVPGCAVGSWLLQSQDFFDQLIADGSGLAERDDWSFRTTMPEAAVVTTICVANPAIYAIEGDTFTYQEEDGGPAEITLELEVDGVRQPMPGGLGTQTVAGQPSSGTGPFSCSADELEFVIEQGGIEVTARFERR